VVGDPVYGGRLRLPRGATEYLKAVLRQFNRQALHAGRLGLTHPRDGRPMVWEAAPPEDMQRLVEALREDLKGE
jgi:23S rRNA pseudouridine1911/1915/1917 synthase